MTKMLSMQDFDSPTFDEFALVAVIADKLHYCEYAKLHDKSQPFVKYIREYPDVSISPDILATRETGRTVSAGDLFLPVHDSIFKKILSAWREKGLAGAIHLAASADPGQITPIVHWIATRLKWAMDIMDRGIYHREMLPASGSDSIADIVNTRDWDTSLIRCIDWHPHCIRLAVVTRDDRIRIFSRKVTVLRHSAQKSVCCVSWRPFAGRELAVACQSGILVWTINLDADVGDPLLLKQRHHTPVTSVTWHPQGHLLVSCSPADLNMLIWDTSRKEPIPLRRVLGGGLCFTRWSPCGSRLFAASRRGIFRVWNTGVPTVWSPEKWTVPSGRIAVACFGPNLTLLFASTDNPATIFSLPLQETIFDVKKGSSDDTKVALPLIDLTTVNFPSDDGSEYVSVGGRIVAMEWDHTGRYLAILFQDSPLVAIVNTRVGCISKVVDVKPRCLVQGFPGEVPNCINFHPNETVAILTIAWSSGRVQHFPITNKESTMSTTYTFDNNLIYN